MQIEAERVAQAYKELKKLLSEREKEVITRYYGISPHVRHTLREIAEIYDVTRERIRQIKVVALFKIGVSNDKKMRVVTKNKNKKKS